MATSRLRLMFSLGALLVIGAPSFADQAPPTPIILPENGLRWGLVNRYPCVQDTVVLVALGFEATACDSFEGASASDSVHVMYRTLVRDSTICPAVMPRFYVIPLRLGRFSAGAHTLDITWVIDHRTPSGRTYREERPFTLDFVVSQQCAAPPPPGVLPFVDHIQIGREALGDPRVCPHDSIPVRVSGHFPSDCFRFRRVLFIPEFTTMNLMIAPPRMRLIVDDGGCLARPCAIGPVPWSASFMLPELPPMAYRLPLELAVVSCSDTFPPGQLFRTMVPFAVLDSCGKLPPPPACLTPLFDPRGEPQLCDAQIAHDRPAKLTLFIKTGVALAGLQGELALSDSALHIERLETTGAATGMLLRWERTARGARFAMVAEQGAPIQPIRSFIPVPAVLQITVALGERRPEHPVTTLAARALLGSDIDGHGVPECVQPLADRPDLGPGVARICLLSGERCDWNGDGRDDIRDLVLMLRCLQGDAPCPDSVVAEFDCDADHAFTIEDVLCCAREILIGHDCDACPEDTVRAGDGVKMAFGPPTGAQTRFDLPVRIDGAAPLGGAKLVLRYPQSRYDVTGVDFAGASANWLHLSQVANDQVMMAVFHPGGDAGPAQSLEMILHLALKPGAQPGGEVTLDRSDFTALDGVKLAVATPRLSQPLAGKPRLALSENRPNPFGGETRFTVTLDRPGHVEVAIYDLTGRALKSIFSGDLPAGISDFAWDGSVAGGAAARDGVYFMRATNGDGGVTRKLVLLRRR